MNKSDLSDKIWRFVKVLYFLLSFVGLLLFISGIWLDTNIGEFLLIVIATILIFFIFTDILLRLINYINVGSNIGLIDYLFYIKKYYKWMFLISIVVICGGILSFNPKLRQSLISLHVFNIFLSDPEFSKDNGIELSKKSDMRNIIKQLGADIIGGATFDEIRKLYPELSGIDDKVIKQLGADIIGGATFDEVVKLYPELGLSIPQSQPSKIESQTGAYEYKPMLLDKQEYIRVANDREKNAFTDMIQKGADPEAASVAFKMLVDKRIKNQLSGLIDSLSLDIKNGSSVQQIKLSYPELSGLDEKIISELGSDIVKGATLDQVINAYPELLQL